MISGTRAACAEAADSVARWAGWAATWVEWAAAILEVTWAGAIWGWGMTATRAAASRSPEGRICEQRSSRHHWIGRDRPVGAFSGIQGDRRLRNRRVL